MNLKGKRIAIVTHNYYEQAELEEPYRALIGAGAEVDIISADSDNLNLIGMHHADRGEVHTADEFIKNVDPSRYDALVLPGGVLNSDALRMVDMAKSWVEDFMDGERPVAAICHAPWLLISAGVIENRRLTSYRTIQDDVTNAGGLWEDSSVVIDGSLITSRQPSDLPKFNKAIIDMLSQQPSLKDQPKEKYHLVS